MAQERNPRLQITVTHDFLAVFEGAAEAASSTPPIYAGTLMAWGMAAKMAELKETIQLKITFANVKTEAEALEPYEVKMAERMLPNLQAELAEYRSLRESFAKWAQDKGGALTEVPPEAEYESLVEGAAGAIEALRSLKQAC